MLHVAEDDDFKFVSIEDDDEVVIQAGIVSPSGDSADAALREDADGRFSANISSAADGHVSGSSDDELQFRHVAEQARRQREREANRMVTTEDDLHASVPFAGMQRVIVIVCALLIAAFVAYYRLGGI